ncbi:hypothetical protein L288_14250 [Sphingobium quisquiliarum P25]|uniref:Cytochrome c domain-containing protein n=1 Tax=Sphingobium quisquiliarum P25 TaxID=1329909 RepID=T0GKC9_9SPHN|nr:cytochrome c [Sphingobium quisquiliarum]EQB04236.1 hypothetical protein L288_14250 [Sphingobium quisquiliarum P25]
MKKMLLLGAACLLSIGAGAAHSSKRTANAVERGHALFEYHCASCHGPGIGNPGHPWRTGTEALQVKYRGELPALLAERKDLTPETVAYFVRNGVSIMAPYRKTEISDADLAALGAYLSRNNPDFAKK